MKIIKSQIYHIFLHLFGPTILILTNFGPRNPFLALFLRFDKKTGENGVKITIFWVKLAKIFTF